MFPVAHFVFNDIGDGDSRLFTAEFVHASTKGRIIFSQRSIAGARLCIKLHPEVLLHVR